MKRLSDFRLRSTILPKITQDVLDRQKIQLEVHSHWTLSLNGWTDKSKNSVYTVILVDRNEQHYMGNLNLSLQRHTASNILNSLKSLLEQRISKIGAIVTDNPNTMLRMTEDFCKKYPRVLNIGCILHAINLVCKDLVQSDMINDEAKSVCSLVVYFTNTDYWRQILSKWGIDNNVAKYLKMYVSTRWYSYINMVQSASDYEKGFVHCVNKSNEGNCPTINPDIIDIIENRQIFDSVKFQIVVLKPLAEAIGKLEEKGANLSDVWVTLFNLYQLYIRINEDSLPRKYCNIVNFVKKSLNKRAGLFFDDVYMISFYLSPRYKLIATSKKFPFKTMHKKIVMHAKSFLIEMGQTEVINLKNELSLYHKNEFPYNALSNNTFNYWTSLKSTNSILSKHALLLLSIVPSSASVERLFSKLGQTKTNFRNRMSVETMTCTGQIKLDAINRNLVNKNKNDESDIDLTFQYEGLNFNEEDELFEEGPVTDKIDIYFDMSMNPITDQFTIPNTTTGKQNWDIADIFTDEEDEFNGTAYINFNYLLLL